MAMPPPSSLDHYHPRRAGQERSSLQQPLRSIPAPLPHDLLYLQHQHQQQQQTIHQCQRLVSEEEVYRMRQWPLHQLNSHTLGCDGLVENLAAAAAYRQNLNGGLESRISYSLARTDLQPSPGGFEFNGLQDDAARSRQAKKHSRIFPFHQQLIGNDYEKVRGRDGVFRGSNEVFGATDDLFRGGSLADSMNRTDFEAWDSKSFCSVPTKPPPIFLDHSRIHSLSHMDLGFLQASSVHQSRSREALASTLPAFRTPPDYLSNKQFSEESLYLEREGLQKTRRQSVFEFGSYGDDLHSSGGRQGRGNSAELQYRSPRNALGAGVTDLYRHGDINPNLVSLASPNLVSSANPNPVSSATQFVDYSSMAGCNSDIIPVFSGFANEKDDCWSRRKRGKKRAKTSILLADRPSSPHFRFHSPARRDHIDDDLRPISQRSDRRLDEHEHEHRHDRLKGRLDFSREQAFGRQTQPFVSTHSRILSENEFFKQHQEKFSKDCTQTRIAKNKFKFPTPKMGSQQHEKNLLSKGVKGNRHPTAGSSKKRPHNKIANVSKSLGKEMPFKYRKIKEINGSSENRARNRDYVVPLSSLENFAASGRKDEIKSVDSREIIHQQQQGNVREDNNQQPVNDSHKTVNGMDAHDILVDRTAEISFERNQSAQGVTQQLQETCSGFQLLEGSQHLHTSSEKLQSFQSAWPSDTSKSESLLVVEPQAHQTAFELKNLARDFTSERTYMQIVASTSNTSKQKPSPSLLATTLQRANSLDFSKSMKGLDIESGRGVGSHAILPYLMSATESSHGAVSQPQSGSHAITNGEGSVWKELEGWQTLDPFQVCLQGPNAVHNAKQQDYPSNIFTTRSSPDRHALKIDMPSLPDLHNLGEKEVKASRRTVTDQSLKSVKHCETGNFVKSEVPVLKQKIAPVDCIVTLAEYQPLEPNDCTPPDEVGPLPDKQHFILSKSEISATIANSFRHSQEQVLSTMQCVADPKNDGIPAVGTSQQHVTSNTNHRFQKKHNTAKPLLNLEEFPSCQFVTKELDSSPLREKQKSSSLLSNSSKPSNEHAEMTKSNDNERKEVLRLQGMEKQLYSKHRASNFTPKPSSRAYFPKHPKKRSVWSLSPATRTWHRDNTFPSTCSHEVPVNTKAHSTAGQSLQVTNTTTSTKSASYVRKGNSLVRTSGIPGNPSTINLKPLIQPETHTMNFVAKTFPSENSSIKYSLAVNSHLGSGASEKNYGTHAIVDKVASSKNASNNFHVTSSELPSTAPVEMKLESSIQQIVHSDMTSSRDKHETEAAVAAVDKLVDTLGNNLRNEGLISTSNSRQGWNNMTPPSMTRLYVRSKANQLVVAPLTVSEDVEDQAGKDGREKQLQDSYVRKKSNQLVRSNFISKSGSEDLLNNVAPRSVSNQILGKRKGKPQVPGVLSTKLARVLSQKKVVGLRVPLVWTLSGTKCQSTIKGSASSLVPWKKPGIGIGLRSRLLKALPKGRKGSLLSLISRKLQDMRMSQPLYTRSANGFSLHRSGVMSLGGANLKWTKSMDKKSKLAREEATKAVAAVAKQRREKKEAVVAVRKARSDRRAAHKAAQSLKPNSRKRIVLVGLVRYSMDPTKRTLQRLPDSKEFSGEISKTVASDSLDASPITPRRASIGGAVYVRVGNGNQLIRDPKTSIRALANEKIRWSLHNARSRALRKQQYCQFFTRFGKCNKEDGRCSYIHDPEKVAVCTKFLNGTCANMNCLLTHKVIPERMPDCSFFLQGLCINECCPYRHVNVNSMAPICEGFLKGYCIDGDRCNKKHTNVCSVYSETGTCPDRTKCKFHHPKKRDTSVLGTGQKIDTKKKRRYFSDAGFASQQSHAQGVTDSMLTDGNIAADSECLDFISLSGILCDPQTIHVMGKNMSSMTREELSIPNYHNSSIEDMDRLIKPAFVFRQALDISKSELI